MSECGACTHDLHDPATCEEDSMNEQEARAAVDDAVGHWHAMQLLAVEHEPKERASAAYSAALDAYRSEIERRVRQEMALQCCCEVK